MLKIWKVDGDHLKELGGLAEADPAHDVLWIDLLNPTVEEDHAAEACLGISVPTKEDMKEIEPSARLYDEDGANYMTMQAVSLVNVENPVKCPITFILHGNALVTVRYEEFVSITNYLARAARRQGVAIASPQGIMLDLIDSFVGRIADTLETLDEGVDKISDAVFRSKKISIQRRNEILQLSIRKIGEKGDLLSMLRESLMSVTRLLSHHNARMPENPHKALRFRVTSLGRDVTALADHANFLANKMNFLLDATLGMINLEQNQIIKIFSIAAVVFLPPTLVASVYGMNFQHMPELGWRFGYPLALLAMVIAGVLPLFYFKKKGWL